MSVSPKPSAPAGIPETAVEIPAGLFFEAGDYTLRNTRPEDLAGTRRRVAQYRSKMKAAVVLQMEDLSRINSSLHAADRQGNGAPHWDAAVVLVAKLKASVEALAKAMDNAEKRHEDSFLIDEQAQEPAA